MLNWRNNLTFRVLETDLIPGGFRKFVKVFDRGRYWNFSQNILNWLFLFFLNECSFQIISLTDGCFFWKGILLNKFSWSELLSKLVFLCPILHTFPIFNNGSRFLSADLIWIFRLGTVKINLVLKFQQILITCDKISW